MEQEQSAYITSVHLKGYKSIRDVSVTLNKGLNILIGANGSGKTNFLAFLDAAYRGDYAPLLNGKRFEVEIEGKPFSLKLGGERIIQLLRSDLKGFAFKVDRTVGSYREAIYFKETIYFDNDKKVVKTNSSDKKYTFHRPQSALFIRFENPLTLILKEKLNISVSFLVIKGNANIIETRLKYNTNLFTFVNDIFVRHSIDLKNNKTIDLIIKEIIENRGFLIDNLQQNLKQFSPINDFKIDWALTRQTREDYDDIVSIDGIDFQFFVNNDWVNWTQLSDGTKRLFYLIGSVTYAKENEIILIEEPELGVHPYQLSLLMNFLKSQSRDKQIIISTHSPQVLNCLGEDELDRIIVARHEGKVGTKLYHLSEREKGVASEFMKNEAFLSDYWMLSGFMNEEMPEDL